ncbi:MAG: cell division FtsA domain-containing protein [Patescibacteria group bacterium]
MLSRLKNLVPTTPKSSALKGQTILALDIGTTNVKAVMVEIADSRISVIGVGRQEQDLADMAAGAIADIQAVVANCNKALSAAEEQAGLRAERVVIGIAGELIKGITDTVTIDRPEATKPISEPEFDEFVKEAQSRAHGQAKHEVTLELSGRSTELRLINSALVSVEVDGYKVTNPIGFQGSTADVQLYTAFAPLVHIGAIEQVAGHLDLDILAVAAEPFAVARAIIGDDPSVSKNAILIDIGGGTTDIAVVRDGGLEGTRMFGIGGRAFTNSIARDMNVSFDQAEFKKITLSEDVSGDETSDIEAALKKTLEVWIQGVQLALSEFDWLDYLPHQIMLCGGGSGLELLQEKLAGETWQKDLPFSKMVQVRTIDVRDVRDTRDRTDSVRDHTMITVLGLARVAADTVSMQPDGSQIVEKISKVVKK